MGLIKDIKELIYADEILDNTRLYYKKTNDIIKNNLNKNEEYSAHYSINDQAKEIIKDYILNGNYNKQ